MPDLTPEQHEALRADIAAHGVVVPVVIDQHGRTLDGHNRRAIAAELGIECPVETRHVVDEEEAVGLAVTLNCARRHLTREQTRTVIAGELLRVPGDSDRAIARRVGCSPTTVGAVRVGQAPSRLDTRQEAEERTAAIRATLEQTRDALCVTGFRCLQAGIPLGDIREALAIARSSIDDRGVPELDSLFGGLIDWVSGVLGWPETIEAALSTPVDPGPVVRAQLLAGIAQVGGAR